MPRSPTTLAILAAVGLAAAAASQVPATAAARPAPPAAASPKGSFPRPELEHWVMPNGLEVAHVRVAKAPVVTVQVWYHVGSKDEAPDRRGSAHMFEHMMFKGTTHVPPEEHARLIDKLGGDVNAFTMEDVTAYHNTLPKQHMDFAVRLEAERMRNLIFRPEMIATEREVVKEEIRQRDNHPIGSAFVRFRELAYTRHPYAWTAGGYITDLDATTPADLKRFYDTYYQPNNAMLIVVGDVTAAEVRASAERWFGKIPRGPEPPRPAKALVEPKQDEARREVVKPSQLGVVIGGFKSPPAASPDTYALDVLARILASGESSRLHRRIVRKDKLGVGAGADNQSYEDPGLFLVYGVFLAPEQGPPLEAALLDEIARVAREPVSPRELAKAKNQLAAEVVDGLETVSGIAMQIGLSRYQEGNPRAWLDEYERYLGVTADDVQRVAKTYLVPENLTLVVVPPAAGGPAGGAR